MLADFYDDVRAFYGACVAQGIIMTFPTFLGDRVQPYLIANLIQEETEEFAYIERAEEDVTRCINLATTGVIDKRIEAGEEIGDLLKPILAVFSSENSSRLKTACAWSLRAHLSTRGLDKVLESAITIEVLMGDRDTSDRLGLTKLIANRCAYALGRRNKEREEIIDFFGRFYKVRSEVVHSGRTNLQREERKIVDEGLNLATRILKHEISLAV